MSQSQYKEHKTNLIKFAEPEVLTEGRFEDDKLVEGAKYKYGGDIIEKGKFNPQGDLISGIYRSRYRGETVYIECDDILTKRWQDGSSDKNWQVW